MRLFNPRTDRWRDHFTTTGPFIVGKTPIGRATVALLDMNEPERAQMRAELKAVGDL